MNLLLFIGALIVSFIAVRIGAIAFQLTGLEWSLAKFQSLSCFTGTGFTTKESELITGSPQRRQIATVLIILGHAGLVTLIATFANSLSPSYMTRWGSLSWVNLIIIIFATLVIYKIFTRTGFGAKFTDFLRARMVKREVIEPVSFEELLIATGGYGVSSIEICRDSPVLNKTLLASELRQNDITVLVVERGGETIPNPSANTKIVLRDRLICFGKLENIRRHLYVIPG